MTFTILTALVVAFIIVGVAWAATKGGE